MVGGGWKPKIGYSSGPNLFFSLTFLTLTWPSPDLDLDLSLTIIDSLTIYRYRYLLSSWIWNLKYFSIIVTWHFHSHMAASGPGGWLCERQWPGGWALLQGLAPRASRENRVGWSHWRVGQNSESLLDKISPSANFCQCLRIQLSSCSAHSPPASHRRVTVKLKVSHSLLSLSELGYIGTLLAVFSVDPSFAVFHECSCSVSVMCALVVNECWLGEAPVRGELSSVSLCLQRAASELRVTSRQHRASVLGIMQLIRRSKVKLWGDPVTVT